MLIPALTTWPNMTQPVKKNPIFLKYSIKMESLTCPDSIVSASMKVALSTPMPWIELCCLRSLAVASFSGSSQRRSDESASSMPNSLNTVWVSGWEILQYTSTIQDDGTVTVSDRAPCRAVFVFSGVVFLKFQGA